jgi:hypothetical protein
LQKIGIIFGVFFIVLGIIVGIALSNQFERRIGRIFSLKAKRMSRTLIVRKINSNIPTTRKVTPKP